MSGRFIVTDCISTKSKRKRKEAREIERDKQTGNERERYVECKTASSIFDISTHSSEGGSASGVEAMLAVVGSLLHIDVSELM